jgi:hypothetical protein
MLSFELPWEFRLLVRAGRSLPAEAERMPSGIRVDLEALGRVDVVSRLQEPGTQRYNLIMGGRHVVDMQVEVDLLRRPVRPLGRNMIGRELNPQPWFTVDVDTVPVVFRFDCATKQSGPKCALGSQVGGVEDDNLSGDPHAAMLPRPAAYRRRNRWVRYLNFWIAPSNPDKMDDVAHRR